MHQNRYNNLNPIMIFIDNKKLNIKKIKIVIIMYIILGLRDKDIVTIIYLCIN